MDLNTIPSDFHWPTQVYRQEEMTLFPEMEELQNHSEERCGRTEQTLLSSFHEGGGTGSHVAQGGLVLPM